MDKLFYNNNPNGLNNNDNNINHNGSNYQQNNQINQFGNIDDDTPAILLEQLAYIDTFMPQLEEDIQQNQSQNNKNNFNNFGGFTQNNNISDMNFLNNNNNFDFISHSLDDRLAEELKIFADESFIFPDEDKPENPDLLNNGSNQNTPNGMPNYNNNANKPGLLGDGQRQNRKDLRNKYLKTNFGNDDNKAFLKRHDYNNNNSNSIEAVHTGYTPSVNSIHSTHTTNFNQSPQFTNVSVPFSEPQQTVRLSEYHTNSLYTMLPRTQHDRYIKILSDLQKLNNQEEYMKEWTLNFSLEEVALLLVFKEYYLPQLPVSMIQYDQFQEPEVVEREMYKVLNMQVKDDEKLNEKVTPTAAKRKSAALESSSSGTEDDSGKKSRKSSLVEDDLETQVKKLIKISEKLQKKVTSLEVENKMLRNLVSKDGNN